MLHPSAPPSSNDIIAAGTDATAKIQKNYQLYKKSDENLHEGTWILYVTLQKSILIGCYKHHISSSQKPWLGCLSAIVSTCNHGLSFGNAAWTSTKTLHFLHLTLIINKLRRYFLHHILHLNVFHIVETWERTERSSTFHWNDVGIPLRSHHRFSHLSLRNHWDVVEKPMVCWWETNGFFMRTQWIATDKPMDCYWKISGLTWVNPESAMSDCNKRSKRKRHLLSEKKVFR